MQKTYPLESKDQVVDRVKYTEKELEYRGMVIRKCQHAHNQRAQKWIELDDMDYETWYWKAKKANEAYIEPKKNDEEVKVVTGTTREKSGVLLSTLLNYNLEADITAYDDNDTASEELGWLMEAMVRKSRDLERPMYEEKRALIYKELVGQGNCFIEEQYMEYEIKEKEIEDLEWGEGIDPKKIKWKEKLTKVYGYCNSKQINGLDLFAGNMREYFIELQPYIIIRRRLSRAEAEMLYSNWERWKYVPMELTNEVNTDDEDDYNDYQMIETEVDFVEEIRYMDKWNNEYMIMLNGVMMLPVGFPLSAMLGVCEYPVVKGDADPISSNFFYSRGVAAKTRMDQALVDEMYKMMIVKTRRSFKPPLGNMTGHTIGPEVFMPGKIIKGLNTEKLKPIFDSAGVTPAEFNMFQFVKGVIDQKTVAPIMEGQAANKGATAREVVEQKQQSMIKIGLPMLGVINMEKRLAWLRIYNILRNWTKPVDTRLEEVKEGIKEESDVYRTLDIDTEFENGENGKARIDMVDKEPQQPGQPFNAKKNFRTPEMLMAEEDFSQKYKGEKLRIVEINPKQLRSLKYKWQVNIEPTEKNTGMLKAAKFEEMITKIMQIFAPIQQMPNMEYVKKRWAILNGESPDKLWQQQQQGGGIEQMMAQMQQGQPQGAPQGPPGGGQLTQQMLAGGGGTGQQASQAPSLNAMLNQ